MKFVDQETLDRLAGDTEVNSNLVALVITANCKHHRHMLYCGLHGGCEQCRCERDILCDDFEPLPGFEKFLRNALAEL